MRLVRSASARSSRLAPFPVALAFGILAQLFGAAACGGSSPPPATQDDTAKAAAASAAAKEKEAEAAKAQEKEKAEKAIPTTCTAGADGLCVPPVDFVKRLCGGSFPDVALTMFAKGTPWTRGYLRRTVEAWNASGGASSNEKVELDEEVLLLVHRVPDTGGMVVSGAGGSYEALRWNGTCVSLMGEEVTTKLPPKARSSKIPWKTLDIKTRDALIADEKIGPVVAEHRKECKGATFGEVSQKCVKVDEKLSALIVDYIRNGGAIPAMEALP